MKRSHFAEAIYRYRSLERPALILEEFRDGHVFLSSPAEENGRQFNKISSGELFARLSLIQEGLMLPETLETEQQCNAWDKVLREL